MPRYNWLSESQLQTKHLGDDLRALRAVGVPYTEDMIANASADALAQASPDDDTAGLVKRYGDATTIRSFDGNQRTVSEMAAQGSSEERRVGTAGVRPCRSPWSRYPSINNYKCRGDS